MSCRSVGAFLHHPVASSESSSSSVPTDDKLQVAADCTDQKPSKAEKDEEVEEEEEEEEGREVEKEENTGAPPVTSAVALNLIYIHAVPPEGALAMQLSSKQFDRPRRVVLSLRSVVIDVEKCCGAA
ncbi:hypothetical protein LSTR_LSTR007231 [Laodelphax striatellus]|uniref:Uncharacterized protein n=1 Tax=Laodelphax striatellus TaxID=195883 RepID=A0A482XD30_LAOST|nr:hypothetical protein LSTR_LSTR007231 [Laodelphax striatellus]